MNKMAKSIKSMQIWLLPLTQTVVADAQLLILLNHRNFAYFARLDTYTRAQWSFICSHNRSLHME